MSILMSTEELTEQRKTSEEVHEGLTIINSRIMDLLLLADKLQRTQPYFDTSMSKLEKLHGDVEELQENWGLLV